eukprot:1025851-Rhodomonas_salina.1
MNQCSKTASNTSTKQDLAARHGSDLSGPTGARRGGGMQWCRPWPPCHRAAPALPATDPPSGP